MNYEIIYDGGSFVDSFALTGTETDAKEAIKGVYRNWLATFQGDDFDFNQMIEDCSVHAKDEDGNEIWLSDVEMEAIGWKPRE